MSDPTRLHMRLKVTDRAVLERLADRYGMSESGVVRFAIRYLDEHGPLQGRGETVDDRPTQMWTTDRTAQVNWIMELASDLHSNGQSSASDYADAETYAETIVNDYLERMAEQHEPMPDWWSDHDRGLLVRFIVQVCES